MSSHSCGTPIKTTPPVPPYLNLDTWMNSWTDFMLFLLISFTKVCRHIPVLGTKDTSKRHNAWRRANVSACRSYQVGDLQATLVTMVSVVSFIKCQRLNSGERSRIVKPCVHFLVFFSLMAFCCYFNCWCWQYWWATFSLFSFYIPICRLPVPTATRSKA